MYIEDIKAMPTESGSPNKFITDHGGLLRSKYHWSCQGRGAYWFKVWLKDCVQIGDRVFVKVTENHMPSNRPPPWKKHWKARNEHITAVREASFDGEINLILGEHTETPDGGHGHYKWHIPIAFKGGEFIEIENMIFIEVLGEP